MAGHDHPLPGSATLADSAAATRRATLYSVGVAAVLILLKLFAWRASGSVAMLSSLADSGLDLVASVITFWAVRYAVVAPDAEHAFGHGKAEAFSSLVQAALVFASAALVGREAIERLLHPPAAIENGAIATAVMAGSVVLTGLLVALQTAALKTTRSVAVAGDRAHYLADLGGNLVGLLGVAAAAFLHILWLDAIAGLVIVLWLVWGAIGVFREAADQLMDKGLASEACARIRDLAEQDPKILGVHELRTRVAGPYVLVQMHADLDPTLTLEQAHEIMVAAEARIHAEFPAADILMHPDPRGRAGRHGGPFGEHDHEHDHDSDGALEGTPAV
jgi:cation diffusion facilitator family transporter